MITFEHLRLTKCKIYAVYSLFKLTHKEYFTFC